MGLLAAGKKRRGKKREDGKESFPYLRCEKHLFTFGEFPHHPGFLILK